MTANEIISILSDYDGESEVVITIGGEEYSDISIYGKNGTVNLNCCGGTIEYDPASDFEEDLESSDEEFEFNDELEDDELDV